MADAPWRCSECGTINEPVANSCRTCGRWPSLFDLEASLVDEVELEDERELAPAFDAPERSLPEPETVEPTTFEPETFEPEGDVDDEAEPGGTSRQRRLASILVPLAFVVYLVISILFSDR